MTIKKAYVVGTNVSKSLSPTIFNYWFKKYQINAEYKYKEVKEKDFDKEIKKILNTKNLCGLNITIPFKEKIIPHLDTLDPHSKIIGAVNCVTKNENTLEGMNTDWIGFQEAIKQELKKKLQRIKKKDLAIVVGYGGSAKAIIYSLNFNGFKKIRVFNRSYEKISGLHNAAPHKLEELGKYFNEGDLIINTIPTNYNKQNILKSQKTTKKTGAGFGFDVVYNFETAFLNQINYSKRIYGHHMLIQQAIPCFYKWFGKKPETDNALEEILESML